MGTSSSAVVDVVCVSVVDNPCDEMGTHSAVDDHMMKVVYEDNKDNGVAFNQISNHHGLDDDSVNHTSAPAAANNTTATTSSSSANHTSRIEELIDFLAWNVSPSEVADIFKCVTDDDSVNHTSAPAAANNTTATTSSSSANHTSRIEELIVDKQQQQQPQVVRPDFSAAYNLLKTKF
nr:hypothetical protein [Tanacetum cinerariifolium]